VLFHPRGKVSRKRQRKQGRHTLKYGPPVFSSMLRRLFRIQEKGDPTLQLGPPANPIYNITYPLVSSILHRHHLTVPHGPPICLNALKCRGTQTQTYPLPNPPIPPHPLPQNNSIPLTLTYTHNHIAKIVLDTLLLRSTYTFFLSSTPSIVFREEASQQHLQRTLALLPFRVCGHMELYACVRWIIGVTRGVETVERGRCQYCPTQWIVRQVNNRGVSPTLCFQVYQNLGKGEGQNGKDHRWRFLTQPLGCQMQIYEWGKEDLEEAFERILCSTVEEFRRQLERSDGQGSWYDPSLMRRAYKTLPESVAAAL
jgi:hypothetical protein